MAEYIFYILLAGYYCYVNIKRLFDENLFDGFKNSAATVLDFISLLLVCYLTFTYIVEPKVLHISILPEMNISIVLTPIFLLFVCSSYFKNQPAPPPTRYASQQKSYKITARDKVSPLTVIVCILMIIFVGFLVAGMRVQH